MNKKSMKQITKTQLTISLVLMLIISITGATYAYLSIASVNNNTIKGNMATVNLELDVNRIYPKTENGHTNVLVPQLSTNAALSSALKGECVDANQNLACQVYEIVIQNNGGTAAQVVDGTISFYSNQAMTQDISTTMPNLKWKLITSVDKNNPTNSVLGTNTNNIASATSTNFASNLTLTNGITRTYYIIIWINELNTDQPDKSTTSLEKNFYAKISVDSSNGTGVTATFTS